MKITQRSVQLSLGLALATIAPSAFAYLDPGTGSFVLQMVIAGALGAMFYIKVAWAGTKAYLSRLFGGQSDINDAADTEEIQDIREQAGTSAAEASSANKPE